MMAFMIKEFTLKQHSILIHFQAKYEDGTNVCLRASEVKPKLDRFLVKKLGGKVQCKSHYKDWIRAEHPNGVDIALKYQMVITRNDDRTVVYESKSDGNNLPDIFYGNLSNDPNARKKYGVFFIGGLTLKIVCFIPELMECISNSIAGFFAVTNFGTMQDKGFGSFTVDGSNVNYAQALKEAYGAAMCYKISNVNNRTNNVNTSSSAVQNELFSVIKQVYSAMKTGSRTPFDHSFLYKYMHEKANIGNEKAHLKITKVSPALGRPHPDQKGIDRYFYVRALLGIGEKIEYITDDPDWYETDERGKIKYDDKCVPIAKENPDTGKRSITKKMKEIVSIENVKNQSGAKYEKNEKGKIERLQSPIFFKIIGTDIYMVAGRVSEKIKGKFFVFANSTKNSTSAKALRKRRNATNGKVVMKVPDDSDYVFDIDDFMSEFVEFYNGLFFRKPDARYRNYKIEEVR